MEGRECCSQRLVWPNPGTTGQRQGTQGEEMGESTAHQAEDTQHTGGQGGPQCIRPIGPRGSQ